MPFQACRSPGRRYLGAAVAANVRIGAPLLTHALFPVFFAVFVWLGLYLRDPRVSALVRQRD